MNRRHAPFRQRAAAWLLVAAFVWIMQPLGTYLFCHDDLAHDHAAHAHPLQEAGHQHSHQHTEDGGDSVDVTPLPDPRPSHEQCCCQPQKTPVTVAAAPGYAGSDAKSGVPFPLAAILVPAYEIRPVLATACRAGPDPPSSLSQFARARVPSRAPPFSA